VDIEKRFEILDKVIEALRHGKCTIHFQDGVVVKVEKIETTGEITK